MARLTDKRLDRFTGGIAAAGFASGDQIVVGLWRHSPLGRVIDVMWIRPDGERVLIAPRPVVRDYITDLYVFDRTVVAPVTGGWDGQRVRVRAGPLRLELTPGPRDVRSWVFALRPRCLRRSPLWLAVEDRMVEPLGELLIGGSAGVRLTGVTPGGRREWYSVEDYRPLATGQLRADDRDAGALRDLRPDLGVGLSAFPTKPAFVQVTTMIEPMGQLHG